MKRFCLYVLKHLEHYGRSPVSQPAEMFRKKAEEINVFCRNSRYRWIACFSECCYGSERKRPIRIPSRIDADKGAHSEADLILTMTRAHKAHAADGSEAAEKHIH